MINPILVIWCSENTLLCDDLESGKRYRLTGRLYEDRGNEIIDHIDTSDNRFYFPLNIRFETCVSGDCGPFYNEISYPDVIAYQESSTTTVATTTTTLNNIGNNIKIIIGTITGRTRAGAVQTAAEWTKV